MPVRYIASASIGSDRKSAAALARAGLVGDVGVADAEHELGRHDRHAVVGQQRDLHAVAEGEALRAGHALELGRHLERALGLTRIDLGDLTAVVRLGRELQVGPLVALDALLVGLEHGDPRLARVERALDGAADRRAVELADLVELVEHVQLVGVEVELLVELHLLGDRERARVQRLQAADEVGLAAVLRLLDLGPGALVEAAVGLAGRLPHEVERVVELAQALELDEDGEHRRLLPTQHLRVDAVGEVVAGGGRGDAGEGLADAELGRLALLGVGRRQGPGDADDGALDVEVVGLAVLVDPDLGHLGARGRRASLEVAEPLLDALAGLLDRDPAGDDQGGPIRRVVLVHELANVLERDVRQLLIIAADHARVGVVLRVDRGQHQLWDLAVGGAGALADLVADHLALAQELLLRDGLAPVEQAHGVDLEQRVELLDAAGRLVVGRVPVGEGVDVGGQLAEEGPQRRAVGPVGPLLEHHVLDQVGDAGLAGRVLARADVVAHVDLDHLRRRVGHDDEAQAVLLEAATLLGVLEGELRRRRPTRRQRGGGGGGGEHGDGHEAERGPDHARILARTHRFARATSPAHA
jgi:hypothetical protein